MNFSAYEFFDLSDFAHSGIFKGVDKVWEVIPRIKDYIKSIIKPNVRIFLNKGEMAAKTIVLKNGAKIYQGSFFLGEEIEIGPNVVVEPGALISSPSIICEGAVIRQGAYIRGSVIVGKNSVVGHTTEMKNSIMTGESKAGHFAYIGDSIIGKVNLGAGTKLANFKLDGGEISVSADGEKIKTGLKKFGAILADGVSTGCNCVTFPGAILGKNCFVYPNVSVRGIYPPGAIIKN